MAKKMVGLIPQYPWINSLFKSSGSDDKGFNDNDHPYDQHINETMFQQPKKRPRVRMDVSLPPGTFTVRSRGRCDRTKEDQEDADKYHDSIEPPPGASTSVSFAALTSAIPIETSNSRSSMTQNSSIASRPILTPHRKKNGAANGTDGKSKSNESICRSIKLSPQRMSQQDSLERKTSLEKKAEAFDYFPISKVGLNHFTIELAPPILPDEHKLKTSQKLETTAPGVPKFHLRAPKTSFVQVEQSNSPIELDSTVLSQTAKEMFKECGRFSSSVTSDQKISSKTSGIYAKKRERAEDFDYGPTTSVENFTKQLAVLKLRRKQKLQEEALAARNIISAKRRPQSSAFLQNGNSAAESQESLPNISSALSTALNSKKRKRDDEYTNEYIWKCRECFIPNFGSTEICIECKTAKYKKLKYERSGKYRWDCKRCLMQNSGFFVICFFCMTPKKKKIFFGSTLSKKEILFFGKDKEFWVDLKNFWPSCSEYWECAGCMLKNPKEVITCPSCDNSKPGLLKVNSEAKEEKIEESPKTQNS